VFFIGVVRSVASAGTDTLVMGITGEPEALDLHITMDDDSWWAIYYCYHRWVKHDGGTAKQCLGLANSREISPDGLIYRLHLRQGVQFTEGAPFNAEAVRFNFERLFAISKGPAGTFEFIDSVDVVDKDTIRFTLTGRSTMCPRPGPPGRPPSGSCSAISCPTASPLW